LAAIKRLIAGGKIDNGKARLHQSHAKRSITPLSVRAAMGKRTQETIQYSGARVGAVCRHDARDTAHQ
jgi:hypothetical protein